MENYCEFMISKKKGAKEFFFAVGLYVLALLISLFALPFKFIGPLVVVGSFYGAYFLSLNINKEFEYILTDTDLDVDLIIAKRKRKRLLSLEGKDINLVASVNDPRHNHVLNEQYTKTIDTKSYTNTREVYFLTYNKDGKNILYFEPNEKMLNMLKKQMPNKVFINQTF